MQSTETFLVVQVSVKILLPLHGGVDSLPDWGTKIQQVSVAKKPPQKIQSIVNKVYKQQ